jgi:hypothetical protein
MNAAAQIEALLVTHGDEIDLNEPDQFGDNCFLLAAREGAD